MRKLQAFLIALFVIAYQYSFAQVFGEVLYGWDFNSGVPTGWTNTSASGIGLWEYRGPNTNPSNAVGPRGTCAGSTAPLASESASNGFMIFDSNYWDDAIPGCGGLGTGVDPAPHNAWLTSNVLNFIGETNVVLTFQESFRLFSATCKVQVSVNNGPWTDAGTNTGLITPSWALGQAVWTTYNISSLVANQSNVRIRFQFSGTYYWWEIDDVYIYSPNNNDLRVLTSSYTVNPTPDNIYNELEYDQYPSILLPLLRFTSSVRNIGGLTQTGASMTSRVLNSSNVQIHSQTTTTQNISSGQTVTFTSPNSYTPPTTLGDYNVEISVTQTQTDENPADNIVLSDFSITPHTYARDEGPAENFFVPAAIYANEAMEIGNVYEGRQNGRKCTSLTVALGEGTAVGSQIRAVIYNEQYDSLITSSAPYTVNLADINQLGEEFTVTLQLTEPLELFADSFYVAMVQSLNGSQPLRICRSGQSPPSTSFVKYYNLGALFFLNTTPVVRMNVFLNSQTPGCTDPTAMNYNAAANVSDSSCRYPGCTIETASNYNPSANFDNGTCIVPGCTNPDAVNFDPFATVDDGSCISGGCTNPIASNYDPLATVDDGSCIIPGCTNPTATNYNAEATVNDGSCIILGCTNPAAANYNPDATEDNGSCLFAGCTNPLAINYDPQATLDNGTCVIVGCTDPLAANYNETANQDNGTCEYGGCTNPLAANFDPDATVDDGSCIIIGCTNPNAINYNPEANQDDGTCIAPGCTDPAADNYDALATEDDGSCIYLGCTDPNAANYDPTAIDDDGSCIYPGCNDPLAINFDPNANENDGSCLYATPNFNLNVLTGCSPLEITVSNLTAQNELFLCEFYLNDLLVHTGCEPNWTLDILEPGVYVLEYRLTSGDEVNSVFSQEITVFETPDQPSLTLNVLEGNISCSNCSSNNGFVWEIDGQEQAPSSSTINIINNGIFNNGIYNLTEVTNNGCSANSADLLVLEPTIEINQTDFCAPLTVEVINSTDLPQGAVIIINSGIGNSQVLNPGSNLYTYINPGTYTMNITLSWNSNVNETQYTVQAGATVTPVLDVQNGQVICINCDGNGTEAWSLNGEPVVGQDPWPLTPNTTYNVVLTTDLGCEADATLIVDNVNELQDFGILLYPNPAKEEVRIRSEQPIEKISIFDGQGRNVFLMENIYFNEYVLNADAFTNGIYTVRIDTGNTQISKRLIISK